MSQRSIRVNALLMRELSSILHTDYRSETVQITISEVDVSPDLRNGRVYYSVLGGAEAQVEAERFFRQHGETIRRKAGKSVVLKYLPHLKFIYDPSMARGNQTLAILDELDLDDDES